MKSLDANPLGARRVAALLIVLAGCSTSERAPENEASATNNVEPEPQAIQGEEPSVAMPAQPTLAVNTSPEAVPAATSPAATLTPPAAPTVGANLAPRDAGPPEMNGPAPVPAPEPSDAGRDASVAEPPVVVEPPMRVAPVFQRRVIDQGYRNQAVTIGEFTGDGQLDLASVDANNGTAYLYPAPDFERVILGKGPRGIHAVTLDVDADGDDDAVFVRHEPGTVFWLEQPASKQATRKWALHTIDSAGSGGANGVHGVAKADMNGDGIPELLGTAGRQKSVYIYYAPANRKRRWERLRAADGDAPARTHYVGAGDVNGDGRMDVAAGGTDGNFFAWWEQPANPEQPWTKHHLSDEAGASHIVMVDLNGDQQMDLLASRGHGVGLLWYPGPTLEPQPLDDTMPRPHAMEQADLDQDGDVDVVAASSTTGGVAWFENDGQGQFTKHVLDARQQSYQIQIADIGEDGDLDIVMSGLERRNLVMFENFALDPM